MHLKWSLFILNVLMFLHLLVDYELEYKLDWFIFQKVIFTRKVNGQLIDNGLYTKKANHLLV